MTLLLGPPSSGKTTLLLALAGQLGKDLKVRKLNRETLFSKLLYDSHTTRMTW
jgi:DNA helicase TIP49 (TBP-interacting protein)